MSDKGLHWLKHGITEAFQAFRLKPVQKVWEWIDANVVVPLIVGSPFPGLMDTGRTPPLRGLFELYWLPKVHFFTLCKSARVGGTVFAICCVLHKIATWPGPILWVDPTRKTGGRFSRAELDPFIMECAPVKAKALTDRERWTTLEKMFKDCTLGIVGTGSPAELGGRQAELLVLNERSKYRHTIDQEAPPAQLAIVRTKQFRHTRKVLENSTPTHEGDDTWQNFLAGTQHYCYVPCPHCSGKTAKTWKPPENPEPGRSAHSYDPALKGWQRLTFFSDEREVPFDESGNYLPAGETRVEKTGKFKFDHCKAEDGSYRINDVEADAKYECASCHKAIDHTELNWMLRRYKWIAHNPKAWKAGHVTAHFWAAYSLFEHWGQVAKNFLLARGSVGKMQDFYNSDLGLPFVRRATDIKEGDIDIIIKMSPDFAMRSLPLKPEMLTMCVDVQGSGFWWTIKAWGIRYGTPELETWKATIDCGDAVSWAQIEELAGIKQQDDGSWNEYTFEGETFRVTAGLIDSGFEAQQNKNVYAFCLKNRHVFSPSKGGAQQLRGKHVTTAPVMDDQLDLVWYHDDTFKQQLYYQCIKEKNGGNWWLPRDIPAEWKAQNTAERTREVKQKNGSAKLEWEVVGPSGNHMGDTEKMHLVLEDTIEQRLDEIRDEWLKANKTN